MGLPRTYKTLEDNTSLGRKKGVDEKDKYFPTLEQYLRKIEKNHILKILTKSCWNLSLASEILEISRPTLANKIKLYNLEKPDINLPKRKMDYLICGYIDNTLNSEEKKEAEKYLEEEDAFKQVYDKAIEKLKKLNEENPDALPDEIT